MKKKSEQLFLQLYGCAPDLTASAPARLEILGNHTDYNGGVALSMAIDLWTSVSLRIIGGDKCIVSSDSMGNLKHFIELSDLDSEDVSDSWVSYLRGILLQLRKQSRTVQAFEMCVSSNIPLSAGMGSSAALEMAFLSAILKAHNWKLSPMEMSKIGRDCENVTIGAATGLLDQLTTLCALNGKLLLSEHKEHTLTHVPFSNDFCFVAINTGVKHNLSMVYSKRRIGCEKVAEALGVKQLADVKMTELRGIKQAISEEAYKRALHVVTECERVTEAVQYLKNGNYPVFGELLVESHQSSQLNFENSCDELDLLVRLANASPLCLGARLSGGGFGGTSIHLVDSDAAEDYINSLKISLPKELLDEMEFFVCHPVSGSITAEMFPGL